MTTLRLSYTYKRDESESLHGPGWSWADGSMTGSEEQIREALGEMQERNAKSWHQWMHGWHEDRKTAWSPEYGDFQIQEIILKDWAGTNELLEEMNLAYQAERVRLDAEYRADQKERTAAREAKERAEFERLKAKFTEGGQAA